MRISSALDSHKTLTTMLEVERFAAFSSNNQGGNPAGVVICAVLPAVAEMQEIAAEVGYSETAFAAPCADGWRIR